jgi:hypothetical protein
MAVELDEAFVRKRADLSRPTRGVKGVAGVVPVQLNDETKCSVAFVPALASEREMSGGSVVLSEGVTLNVPPDTTSKDKY